MNRTVNFHLPSGSIGLEAIFSRMFVGHLDYMRQVGIRPVLVFTAKAANGFLNTLIKRKLDELSVPWIDYSSQLLASKLFIQKLKAKGYRFYDVAGWPRYFDKNKRYLERLGVVSKSTYADAIFDTFDYEVFESGHELSFTAEEDKAARDILGGRGIERDFVCIHPRDDLFHGTVEPQRNIPLDSFIPACSYMASQELAILKMGIGQDDARVAAIPGLTNYPSEFRSEMMDVWLIANAKFYLGSNSGLFYVAYWFDTPVAIVNYTCFTESTPQRAQDVYLPQKIWSKELKRMLRFSEISAGDIGLTAWSHLRYKQANLEPVTSSAEEVAQLAVEMNERVDGTFVLTPDDIELQNRFRRLFKPSHAPYYATCQVGRDFLRNNTELLN